MHDFDSDLHEENIIASPASYVQHLFHSTDNFVYSVKGDQFISGFIHIVQIGINPDNTPIEARALFDSGCQGRTNCISNYLAQQLFQVGATLKAIKTSLAPFSGSTSIPITSSIEASLVFQTSEVSEVSITDKFLVTDVDPRFDCIIGSAACCKADIINSEHPYLRAAYKRDAETSTATVIFRPIISAAAREFSFTHTAVYDDPIAEVLPDDVDAPDLANLSKEEFILLLNINPDLQPHNRAKLADWAWEYRDIFVQKNLMTRMIDVPGYECNYKKEFENDPPPKRFFSHKMSPDGAEQQRKLIEQYKRAGAIGPVDWDFVEQIIPSFILRTGRWVQDCVVHNSYFEEFRYFTPTPRQMIDFVKDADMISTMDVKQGFNQAPILEAHTYRACVMTVDGIVRFRSVVQGMHGAAAWFMYLMNCFVLVGLVWFICLAYIDDVSVKAKGRTEDERTDAMVVNLRKVGNSSAKHNVKYGLPKLRLGYFVARVMGYDVGQGRIKLPPESIEAFTEWEPPTTVRAWQKWLGFINHYARHMEGISELSGEARELYAGKDKGPVPFNASAKSIFDKMKAIAIKSIFLHFPDDNKPLFVIADGSKDGTGSEIFQMKQLEGDTWIRVPIAFGGHRFTERQRSLSTPDKEALALAFALRDHAHFLHRHFILYGDHKNLLKMLNFYTETSSVLSPGYEKLRNYLLARTLHTFISLAIVTNYLGLISSHARDGALAYPPTSHLLSKQR